MNELKSYESFDELEEQNIYWTDSKSVFYRNFQIKSADLESFEHFFGVWAKDKRNCYSGATKLKDADPNTFSALNMTYAKDKENVWVLAGVINDADANTFEICDSGQHSLGKSLKRINDRKFLHESFVPYGFGRDKNNVYYYDFQGKGKIVKKANAETFVSLNDSYFGHDDKCVFCGISVIPKANPKSWEKFKENYFYSKDRTNVFYFNRQIKDVDVDTFEIVELPRITGTAKQYAKDKFTAYWNDRKISFAELNKEIEEAKIYYDKMIELLK
ncbi:DKNYY domain-containing protein [Epilithonimonas zeae]|uniref:DKNYY domain-containing protein n=1 Tax=Epilithonimonas zeae TaxID=1416779 RepID=UPI00200BC1FF|nr:DKNYY domain-containing protein [Epilithonimonas zeae]UQB69973.1 DKNYY domain-containing protein [Epilithonimonas zeae]